MGYFLKKFRELRSVQTYWGFPVDVGASAQIGQSQSKSKKGVALVIAIIVITILMLFTTDLILSSQVNLQLATAQRDNVKAEYMARSSLNAAILLLSSDLAFDLFQAQQSPKNATLQDGKGDFWSALNGFPIGGETAEMLGTFQESMGLSKVLDGGVLEQLKLFDGSFVVNVEDEGQKINLNTCHHGRCSETILMLEALFSCPAEKMFLDSKNLNAKELAFKIKDWVDEDSRAEAASGVSDEGDPYSRRLNRTRTKNAPFDSVEELRIIDGWDDEVHAVFSDYLTVWPLQKKNSDKAKINLNTASRSLLTCLFPEAKGDCSEKSTLALTMRNKEKTNLGQPGQSINDVLQSTLCYTGGSDNSGEASNRANWFAMNSMVFSVEANGIVGDQEKTLHAVIERRMPDPKKGESASYKILYWKMI